MNIRNALRRTLNRRNPHKGCSADIYLDEATKRLSELTPTAEDIYLDEVAKSRPGLTPTAEIVEAEKAAREEQMRNRARAVALLKDLFPPGEDYPWDT